MTAQHAKQIVKNALYRTIGETSTAFRLPPESERPLRVLMYHKVNDQPDNPTTVPVAYFDEQLSRLGELGYEVVGLDAVLDLYTSGVSFTLVDGRITAIEQVPSSPDDADVALPIEAFLAVLFGNRSLAQLDREVADCQVHSDAGAILLDVLFPRMALGPWEMG